MESSPEYEPNSTPPKLSLCRLPSKLPEPPGTETPPLQTLVSIPFQWEEEPGKPRASRRSVNPAGSRDSKTAASRSLDLPPRLVMLNYNSKITKMSSPTTVLEGPYAGRPLSRTLSFSFRKAAEEGDRRQGKERGNNNNNNYISSWRWGSFREDNRRVVGGSFDFSPSVAADDHCFTSASNVNSYGGTKVNIARSRIRRGRVNSFLSFSDSKSSNMWANIYDSFKKAVPWKSSISSRQQQKI